MRVLKEPEERRNEILDTAEMLFGTKGYSKTTVNDILQTVGIAKGTFYYYFKSKEEVMDAIVMRFIDAGTAAARAIVADQELTVHEKLLRIIMAQKPDTDRKDRMIEQFHQVNNAEMHQKSLVETVIRLTPVLTEVVEQGIREGLFKNPYPAETVEFFLVASQFLFDDGIFKWQPHEIAKKIQAFIHLMEIALKAEIGSFAYIANMVEDMPEPRKEEKEGNDGNR